MFRHLVIYAKQIISLGINIIIWDYDTISNLLPLFRGISICATLVWIDIDVLMPAAQQYTALVRYCALPASSFGKR